MIGRWFVLSTLLVVTAPLAAAEPEVTFRSEKGSVAVSIDGKPFATYVYSDPLIPRPYFKHLHAPDGTQVTRTQPPIKGTDSDDHPTFHPGVWLAFGDLNGADFWRNKAKVEHERFAAEPTGGAGTGTFTVVNRYVAGGKTLARETTRYTILVRPAGHLLLIDTKLTGVDGPLVLGDQEEMGLGVRAATPLTVTKGGTMTDNAGRVNERGIWGKPADWCDCSKKLGGRHVGVTLMVGPDNFRKSWLHARDYGVMMANAFGRAAYTKGPPSRVETPLGKELRLRYGVLAHSGPSAPDLAAAYADFVKQFGE